MKFTFSPFLGELLLEKSRHLEQRVGDYPYVIVERADSLDTLETLEREAVLHLTSGILINVTDETLLNALEKRVGWEVWLRPRNLSQLWEGWVFYPTPISDLISAIYKRADLVKEALPGTAEAMGFNAAGLSAAAINLFAELVMRLRQEENRFTIFADPLLNGEAELDNIVGLLFTRLVTRGGWVVADLVLYTLSLSIAALSHVTEGRLMNRVRIPGDCLIYGQCSDPRSDFVHEDDGNRIDHAAAAAEDAKLAAGTRELRQRTWPPPERVLPREALQRYLSGENKHIRSLPSLLTFTRPRFDLLPQRAEKSAPLWQQLVHQVLIAGSETPVEVELSLPFGLDGKLQYALVALDEAELRDLSQQLGMHVSPFHRIFIVLNYRHPLALLQPDVAHEYVADIAELRNVLAEAAKRLGVVSLIAPSVFRDLDQVMATATRLYEGEDRSLWPSYLAAADEMPLEMIDFKEQWFVPFTTQKSVGIDKETRFYAVRPVLFPGE